MSIENEAQIKSDYLKGMNPVLIAKKYGIDHKKLKYRIKNAGWTAEKKEILRKQMEEDEYWIKAITHDGLKKMHELINEKGATEDRVLKIMQFTTGYALALKQGQGLPNGLTEIPSFVNVIVNNDKISDNPKLDKTANPETIIDVGAES